MSGLTSARSNRGGSRGTRMTGQTYDFSARDGTASSVPIKVKRKIIILLKCN